MLITTKNFPKAATNRIASDAQSSRETSRSPPSARHGRRASPVLPSIEAKPAKKPTQVSTAGPSRASFGIESKPVLAIEPLADPFNDPPLRTLLAALDGELMNEKTTITPKKLLNNFYFKYKFPTYKPETKFARGEGVHRRPVEEVFHRNAKDLLKLIDKDKYGAIYDWLAELSKTPLRLLALKPSDFPYRIVPRDTTARKAQAEQSAAAATPLALRRRSSTRPQTPPRAGKGMKTPGRSSKSVLRPIKSTKKRGRGSDDDDSDESDTSPSKKPQYQNDEIEVYEDMDIDVPNNDTDDDSSDEDDSSDAHTPTSKPAPMMKLFSEKISTVIPRGNAKSWLCTESDCGFAVRSGDDLADRATMKEHMEEHRQASRMDIIMSEQRAHLPIRYDTTNKFLYSIPLCPGFQAQEAVSTPEPTPSQNHTTSQESLPQPTDNPSTHTTLSPTVQANLRASMAEKMSFHNLVHSFKRQPHPVSDKLNSLTRM